MTWRVVGIHAFMHSCVHGAGACKLITSQGRCWSPSVTANTVHSTISVTEILDKYSHRELLRASNCPLSSIRDTIAAWSYKICPPSRPPTGEQVIAIISAVHACPIHSLTTRIPFAATAFVHDGGRGAGASVLDPPAPALVGGRKRGMYVTPRAMTANTVS